MGEAKRREEYEARELSVTSVSFRDGVYFDGKQTIATKEDATIELGEHGVLVQVKGRKRVLVPFSNVKWMQVE